MPITLLTREGKGAPLTVADHDTNLSTIEAAINSLGSVSVADHVAEADPHTQYQKESEKGQANGYAELGAGGLVPIAQLASGTPDGTKFIRDDGTLVVPNSGNTFRGFQVSRTADQSINSGVSTKIQYNVELYDTDNEYDSATNYRHTPTAAGKWEYTAAATLETINANTIISLYIYKNGVLNVSTENIVTAVGTNNHTITRSVVIGMNGTTDYVEVFFSHTTGAAKNVSGGNSSSTFSGKLLF